MQLGQLFILRISVLNDNGGDRGSSIRGLAHLRCVKRLRGI